MFRQIQCLFIAVIILCTCNIVAQRPGLLPPSVKWQQLKHDSLRIIFPEGEEERANRVASLMLKLASTDPVTVNGRYRPISVLLQPQTNISNGYVQLAPYMSEFYLQPNENPFTLGSLPWHDLLAIHEYRHVQQINSANRSLSHIIKLIFGEMAFSGMYSLSIPNWFREGDAVNAETKWTNQGRGRLSSFTLPFHEKLLQGRTWGFYKLRNGSYKEFVPDFYSMGYLMIQFGDHVFKEETWDTIVHIAPTFRHFFSPFSGTMKEIYGKKNKHFYLDAMEWYAVQWEGNTEKDIIYPLVSMDSKDMADDFFDMAYPCVSKHGTVYATVSTFDHTEAIYKFEPDGSKEKVTNLGIQQDPYFDYKNHRLVWTELRFDPRWNRKDKNVIVVLDEETGKKFSIEPSKGFFTPSLDKNGNRIVALHVDQQGNNQLQILDAKNGGLLATLPNPDNLYLGYPIWSENELSIIATARDKEGKMAIVEEDIATGNIKLITHYSYNVLGRPFLHENWIYITTSLDTLDQVYAVDRNEGIFYRLTQGSTAHYDPTWDETRQEIVCSEYRLNGKKLIRIPGEPSASWKLKGLNDGIKNIIGREENLLAPSTYKPTFVSDKYSTWSNAINVHSWTLKYDDPYIGAEVRSDNIMNNLSLAGGFEYNANSRAMGPYFNARLGMWYPVIDLGVSQTFRNRTYDDGNDYRETNDYVDVGVSLPLLFSSGVWQQALNVSSTYFAGFSRVRPVTPEEEDFRFNFIRHRAILSNARLRSYRQVLPTFGQRFEVSYSSEVTGVTLDQLYASTHLAFPGLMPSHSLLLQGEVLSQDISEESIIVSSPYEGARGFDETDGEKQYHVGLTYEFPIWYPDIGLGTIFYCRRVRLQPFYDAAYLDDGVSTRWMQSAGAEIVLDIKFPPIALGFRYSILLAGNPAGKTNVFEFFIPVLVF